MTPKERALAAFSGDTTDRVPIHHITFSSRVASAILGREAYVGGGIQQWRESCALWESSDAHTAFVERSFRDAIDLAVAMEHDVVRVTYWRMRERPTARLDEHTFRYGDLDGRWRVMRFDPRTELYQTIASSETAPTTLEDLERHVATAERAAERYEPTEREFETEIRAQREIGNERLVRVGGVSLSIPYDAIWLEAVALRPDLVERLLDAQVERALRRIPFLAKLGFRTVWGGGDFASEQGPFYSPAVFRRFLLPRLQRISEACHQHGLYHLFGSDGNLWPVAEDLFDRSGIDGLYEVDRRAGMSLAKVRERHPSVTLIGNISSHVLHRGTPEEVIAETRECLDAAKRYGRIIVGCSNLIMPETPLANLEAMIDTIRAER